MQQGTERERGDWPLWKKGFEFFVLSSWPAGVTDVANSKIAVDRFSLSRQGFLLRVGYLDWSFKTQVLDCAEQCISKATKVKENEQIFSCS